MQKKFKAGRIEMEGMKVVKRITREDGAWVITQPVRLVHGPVVCGWYADVKALSMSEDGTARVKVMKYDGVREGLKAMVEVREVEEKRLEYIRKRMSEGEGEHGQKGEWEEEVKEKEELLRRMEKFYCVAYSRHRIRGWAVVTCFRDYSHLTQAATGGWLPICKSRAFDFEDIENAVKYMKEEIELSKERMAKRKVGMGGNENVQLI